MITSFFFVVLFAGADPELSDFSGRMAHALGARSTSRQQAINEYCQILVDFPDHPQIYEVDLAIINIATGRFDLTNRREDEMCIAMRLFPKLLRDYPVDSAAGQQIAIAYLDFQFLQNNGTKAFDPPRCREVWEALLAQARSRKDRLLEMQAVARQVRGEARFGKPDIALKYAVAAFDAVESWYASGELSASSQEDLDSETEEDRIGKAFREIENAAAFAVVNCESPECIAIIKGYPRGVFPRPNPLELAIEGAESEYQKIVDSQEEVEALLAPPVTPERSRFGFWVWNVIGATLLLVLAFVARRMRS